MTASQADRYNRLANILVRSKKRKLSHYSINSIIQRSSYLQDLQYCTVDLFEKGAHQPRETILLLLSTSKAKQSTRTWTWTPPKLLPES